MDASCILSHDLQSTVKLVIKVHFCFTKINKVSGELSVLCLDFSSTFLYFLTHNLFRKSLIVIFNNGFHPPMPVVSPLLQSFRSLMGRQSFKYFTCIYTTAQGHVFPFQRAQTVRRSSVRLGSGSFFTPLEQVCISLCARLCIQCYLGHILSIITHDHLRMHAHCHPDIKYSQYLVN